MRPGLARSLGLGGCVGSEVRFMDDFYQFNRDLNVEEDEETGISYNLSGMPWAQRERTNPDLIMTQTQAGGARG